MDNLIKILTDRVVRGSTRMITGKRPVVCLFDVPIPELAAFVNANSRRRYEPFGIAVKKRCAFAAGARPVIYMPNREARELFDDDQMWRVAALDLNRHPPLDWTFEREWRVEGDLPLDPRDTVALVETWKDVDEVYDRFDGKPPCSGVMPLKEMARSKGSIAAPR
jgi:hypothetical protein